MGKKKIDPRKRPKQIDQEAKEQQERIQKALQTPLKEGGIKLGTTRRDIDPEDFLITALDMFGRDGIKKLWDAARRNHPPKVQDLIKKAKPEIARLWDYISSECKFYEGPDRFSDGSEGTDLVVLKGISLKWVRLNKTQILEEDFFKDETKWLSLEDFTPGIGIEYPGEDFDVRTNIKRIFIGKLCQVIISHHFPDILPNLQKGTVKRNYGYKSLYYLYELI